VLQPAQALAALTSRSRVLEDVGVRRYRSADEEDEMSGKIDWYYHRKG
jgi:hypothetical protein